MQRQNISPGNSANSGLIARLRKSPLEQECVVGPGGLELPNQAVMSELAAIAKEAPIGGGSSLIRTPDIETCPASPWRQTYGQVCQKLGTPIYRAHKR